MLNCSIKKIAEVLSIFCENSAADFTPNRNFTFETTLKNIICIETGSLKDKLLKLNDFSLKTPTASAFVQARSKIKVDAFQSIVHFFSLSKLKTRRQYSFGIVSDKNVAILT